MAFDRAVEKMEEIKSHFPKFPFNKILFFYGELKLTFYNNNLYRWLHKTRLRQREAELHSDVGFEYDNPQQGRDWAKV